MRLAVAALALSLGLSPAAARAGLRPAYGGTVRVALPDLPREPDPARATGVADLFLADATAGALLEPGEEGALVPGLLAEVPAPDAGGQAFRLRLRAGLRRPDGAPFTAHDLAASIARLLAPGSPHAWAALPLAGADAVLDGRAASPSGLRVLSEGELLVTLAFSLPELPELLASLPFAVRGMGPFLLPPELPARGAVRLAANPGHARGRPFADALELVGADARRSARLLGAGEVDLVLRPELQGPRNPGPGGHVVTVAALAPGRLGAAADGVRRVLASLDRAELARRFVRGPSRPLHRIVPDEDGDPPAPAPAPAPPERVALPRPLRVLVSAGAPDQRALAGRIQVKLFDRGVRAVVEGAEGARYSERLAAGDYDVALVTLALATPAPVAAAGQIALATRGPAAARSAMRALAGLPRAEALRRAEDLGRELDLVPLVATGVHAGAGPRLAPARPGDLWLAGGGASP
jgi:peptide/nickel transport system substrate-binding protein